MRDPLNVSRNGFGFSLDFLSVGFTVMLGCSSAGLEINENCRFETESRFQSFLSVLRLFVSSLI